MRRFVGLRLRTSILSTPTVTTTPISNQYTGSNTKHKQSSHFHCTSVLRIHGHEHLRKYSSSSSGEANHNKEIDEINMKFAEAREEIETAMESKETVYFDEEAECARDAVKDVLDLYNGLLAKLPDTEKGALQRSMGLKIEQLKAEIAQLDDSS